ncbi:RHS repeat-associated core domain-containing protein [Pseudomonas frederiksbergensis]|uniref:RHS repeat-associated core domain-containing protein n=1 Tax=Pseudomonas frederiksbergensis TaxID=104087 RepID=UPI0009D64DB5|nr:RHS repeat-associated core domain-containing protein [Pseudomonas frederiksbergensis]
MSASPRETILCRYHYDPLDRLVECAPSAEADTQRFYCKSRLATEIQGLMQTSVFQHEDQLLGQQQSQSGRRDTTLLATDQQRSVLNTLNTTQPHPLAYTPYGHRPAENGLLSLLGFNGERPDPVTGHYHLGNGYRQFNPVMMRFNSADSSSPFGKGGVNPYTYCQGNPVNQRDPTGRWVVPVIVGLATVAATVGGMVMIIKSEKDPAMVVSGLTLFILGAGVGGSTALSLLKRSAIQRRTALQNSLHHGLSPRNAMQPTQTRPQRHARSMSSASTNSFDGSYSSRSQQAASTLNHSTHTRRGMALPDYESPPPYELIQSPPTSLPRNGPPPPYAQNQSSLAEFPPINRHPPSYEQAITDIRQP